MKFIAILMMVFFTAVTILPSEVFSETKTKKSSVVKFKNKKYTGKKLLVKRDPLVRTNNTLLWVTVVGGTVLTVIGGYLLYRELNWGGKKTIINVKQQGLQGPGFTF